MEKANVEVNSFYDYSNDLVRKQKKLHEDERLFRDEFAKIEKYEMDLNTNSDMLTDLNP